MPAAIETINLTRRYGRALALDNLNLTVAQGSIYGFIGPNGAGKTTTLRILAGLLTPTSGAVHLMGKPIGANQHLVGYMPDVSGTYEHLRVWEFLDFFARCHGLEAAQRQRTVDSLLDLVGLGTRRNVFVQDLSRGLQQRLSLAHALVHDPPILLLDEPASGLDPRARVELRELLVTLRDLGKTILLSSHILSELAEICNEVGIIESGRMVVNGSVDEVQRQIQGSTKLRIKVLNTPQQAEAALRLLMKDSAEPDQDATELHNDTEPAIHPDGLPIIRHIAVDMRDPRILLVEVKTLDEGQQAALLRYLATQEIAVSEFRAQTESLEDLFLRLTAA